MRTFTITFCLFFQLVNQSIFSQQSDIKLFNPFSNKISIAIEGGGAYPGSDFTDDKISYIGQLSLDYFFPGSSISVFGVRGFGYYGQLKGSGKYFNMSSFPTVPEYYTEIAALGAGITYTLNASELFYPYAFLGADYMYFNPKDKNGNKLPRNEENWYANFEWSIVGEIGSRFLISNSISFNVAAAYHYLPSDNLDDVDNAITNGTKNDMFITGRAGFSFYFGGTSDADNDGVNDEDDLCPDTPLNIEVDEFGCPIDTDKDGVADYLDKCPYTSENVMVDQNGCPLDVDGDGIPDYIDLCNDTPIGVNVDSNGCPFDSDEDGVPDFKDLCSNTPVGTEVDKSGCPIEETVVAPIKKIEFILNGGINFESGKSDLLPYAYPELDKVLKVMRDHPETKWKIKGHTDNTGSYKLNKDLSLKRAQSVYNYFLKNGINGARLFVNGYGPDFPFADNRTETGKTLNRRVAITLVSDANPEAVKDGNANVRRIYNPTVEKNVRNMIFTDGYLYCFQVSSWQTKAKAEKEAEHLESKGFNSFIVVADLPELGGIWYRVRIGYFNSLGDVKKVMDNFDD